MKGDHNAALENLGIISQSEKNQWNGVENIQATKEDKQSYFDDTTNDIMKLTDFYLTLEEQMLF